MFRIHRKFKCLAGLGYAGLAGSSAALLLIVAMMLFVPTTSPSEVSAIASDAGVSTYASAAPTASLSVPATINFSDVLPSPAGVTTTATADITVTTTDSGGYSLYFYASDGDNRLKPLNPANASVVVATAEGSAVALDDLANNTWGYSLGTSAPDANTTYAAVPTDNAAPVQTQDTSDTNSANDTYTLSLGAKVDSTIPSGTYTNTLTVAVVAEPRALPHIQDFTLADCQSQAADADLTLRDKRDNNEYTVRYINGACWMTQNLRLTGGQTLTPAESNLIQNWTFPDRSLDGNDANYVGNLNNSVAAWASNTTYGGYYNYCGASAGTVCADREENALQDICPKNWRLPNDEEMNSVAGTSYLDIFPPSGVYTSGMLSDLGSSGAWWGSTPNSLHHGATIDLDGTYIEISVDDALHTRKYGYGFSIRCVRSNPGTITINFNGNGATAGSTASQQIAAGNTASLNTNGFTRTGHAFTGWNTTADGSGTSYADGADYAVTPAIGNTTITLYAQWGEIPTTMQGITATQCQKFASDAPLTLTDTRDNNAYTVRYINGACWMTQNLRIASGTQLTSADSNLPVGKTYTIPSADLTSGSSYTEGRVHAGEPSNGESATDTGYWYNFCAASAGEVCSSSQAQDATQDICPKGWSLPNKDQIDGLDGTAYLSAFAPVTGGHFAAGTSGIAGYGFWWSSTSSSRSTQYYLFFNGSILKTYDDSDGSRSYGNYVRCVRSS